MGKVQSAHSKGDETNDAEAEVQRAALSLFTIKYSELTILETLSNTAKGKVLKVSWRGDVLAAKQLNDGSEIWTTLKIKPHSRIVRFRGVTYDPEMMLLLDFMEGVRLLTAQCRRDKPLPAQAIIQWLCDVCYAMHHINQEGFVYRDLALRNILLDKAGEPTEQRAVLADLGWMVKKGPDGVAHESISSAPWRIMAPETMGEQQAFSEKSDVWSFSVLIFSLIARQRPFEWIEKPADVRKAVLEGSRLSLPALIKSEAGKDYKYLKKIHKVFTKCHAGDPEQRPTFTEISGMLQ